MFNLCDDGRTVVYKSYFIITFAIKIIYRDANQVWRWRKKSSLTGNEEILLYK